MWGHYYRKRNPKRAIKVIAGVLALFILGLIGAYQRDSQTFYRNFGYLTIVIALFFIIRYFFRKRKEQMNFINNIQGNNQEIARLEGSNLNESPAGITIGQTKYSRRLWAALKQRGVDSTTEYNDGHKHIDLAILPAKLYIEVDGMQHFTDPNQVISDFHRDYYSNKDGFHTWRIPNDMVKYHLNEIADAIVKVANSPKLN
jgi:very-short-patch-repair endonuclease